MTSKVLHLSQTSKEAERVTWSFPECGEETTLEVRVGKGVKVTVVEEFVGQVKSEKLKMKSWSHETEVFLEEDAQLEFISVQSVDSSVALTLSQKSQLSDNASIQWKNVTLSAGSVDQKIESLLEGKDATSSVDWMFYARGEEKYSLSARNIFRGRHGGGEITMKGVAEEKGHVRCDGMIIIGENGGQTDTYLTQDVLMLDTTAKVDAIPGLEIKTNDVKASHSATVSRVTDEDLFYFAARGIAEREARRMYVEGFLGDLVAKIGDAQEREAVLGLVEAKYQKTPMNA